MRPGVRSHLGCILGQVVRSVPCAITPTKHDDMERAVSWMGVRWALNSAMKTTTATLTLCVLPAWDGNSNTAYNRVVADPPAHCHVLMRIPKRNFKFCTPDAGNGEIKYAGCPKWDVNFLLIGNEQGYAAVPGRRMNMPCACAWRKNLEHGCREMTPEPTRALTCASEAFHHQWYLKAYC
jgi:hypothetical protein